MKLSKFETRLLEFVLASEKPELLEQVPNLVVIERIFTGKGIITELKLVNSKVKIIKESFPLGRSVYGKNADFDDIIRFDIYVIDGQLDSLEIVCNYTSELPNNLDDFELAYLE